MLDEVDGYATQREESGIGEGRVILSGDEVVSKNWSWRERVRTTSIDINVKAIRRVDCMVGTVAKREKERERERRNRGR